MTEQQLFGHDDLEKLIAAYDKLVGLLSEVYYLQDPDEIYRAHEDVEHLLAEMGFYDV